jgi:hypothetical protein
MIIDVCLLIKFIAIRYMNFVDFSSCFIFRLSILNAKTISWKVYNAYFGLMVDYVIIIELCDRMYEVWSKYPTKYVDKSSSFEQSDSYQTGGEQETRIRF